MYPRTHRAGVLMSLYPVSGFEIVPWG